MLDARGAMREDHGRLYLCESDVEAGEGEEREPEDGEEEGGRDVNV